MGLPKLLLRIGDKAVIERVVAAVKHPRVGAPVVVVRADDDRLRKAVESAGGIVVQPLFDPPDMRTSVEFGLAYIHDHFKPRPDDVWLLSPADHPVLDPSIVPALVAEWNARQPRILVPTHRGQRGHPTLFRWDLADEVQRLPDHVGLNHLLRTHAADVLELPVESPGILFDLDTPDDFAALASRFRESNAPGA